MSALTKNNNSSRAYGLHPGISNVPRFILPCDWSLPAQPISIPEIQSEKMPTNVCAPHEVPQKCVDRI